MRSVLPAFKMAFWGLGLAVMLGCVLLWWQGRREPVRVLGSFWRVRVMVAGDGERVRFPTRIRLRLPQNHPQRRPHPLHPTPPRFRPSRHQSPHPRPRQIPPPHLRPLRRGEKPLVHLVPSTKPSGSARWGQRLTRSQRSKAIQLPFPHRNPAAIASTRQSVPAWRSFSPTVWFSMT